MKKTLRLDTVRVIWQRDPSGSAGAERCFAFADVSYPININGDRRMERLTSSGLNDIQGATGGYRTQIEVEQLEELRDHLRVFGVPVSRFAQVAGVPELQE